MAINRAGALTYAPELATYAADDARWAAFAALVPLLISQTNHSPSRYDTIGNLLLAHLMTAFPEGGLMSGGQVTSESIGPLAISYAQGAQGAGEAKGLRRLDLGKSGYGKLAAELLGYIQFGPRVL